MMNEQIQEFCRSTLKNGVEKLTDEQKKVFALMYSHKNPDLPLSTIIDRIHESKLDWAMQQISNTPK